MRESLLWIIAARFLKILFMLLMARSGLAILSSFPKLYWDRRLLSWTGVVAIL